MIATAVQDTGPSWTAEVSTVDADDTGVRHDGTVLTTTRPGTGYLVLAQRDLDRPVNRVVADVDAVVPDGTSVRVEVRGLDGDRWTQWTPAGSTLDRAVTTVQARVELTATATAAPEVRSVGLRGEQAPAARAEVAQDALTYEVFATREGLVGGTTANGHVITERDHFVALPSGRSLSPKDTGDYSVRVCLTDGSRCAYAAVWDVGPWNTKDDYWSPSDEREMWTDLPQGTPQAQAAHEDGYNGGKDQFDRTVANPAGIDLADGTFWDGLGMDDNGWVNATYLWTGSGETGEITTDGGPLTVRADVSTDSGDVGLAGNRAGVPLECQATGTSVTGPEGTTDVWYRIGPGHHVSAAFVDAGSAGDVPAC
ncbi:hypothetical protein [Prauserella cavernicola]|nr:hypothetical protein [Prauserella cavernicola]